MADEAAQGGNATLVARAKAYFDMGKMALLAAVILVALFYPPAIGLWIGYTGITKGKFFGIEWETKLTNTDQALQQAQADKLKLEDQLKLAEQQIKKQADLLEAAQRRVQGEEAAQIESALDASKKTVTEGQAVILAAQQNAQAAQRTIAANSTAVSDSGAWVVLTGSDPTPAAAQHEVARARAAGFTNVKMIRNKNVYRTGIIFADRQAAFDALPGAKQNLRADAYAVSMSKFCPNQSNVTADSLECT